MDNASRAIGKIVSVSADCLVVELHRGSDNFTVVGFDDVHYIATLGSYLMVPTQSEYVVLEVIGLREKDFSPTYGNGAEMDKATAAKFLDVVPVGSMPVQGGWFKFGVSTFPPLYADALYARDEDLDRIFNVEQPAEQATKTDAEGAEKQGTVPHTIEIGTSAVFSDYPVKAQLDALFGGHVAVLGNTGSGKSCTVASIFQSVFMKPDEFGALGASFVIFDVNGEYRQAINKLPQTIKSSYLKATDPGAAIEPPAQSRLGAEEMSRFRLPHWFMTVDEWALLLRASERAQQPALRMALGLTTLFAEQGDGVTERKAGISAIQNHVLAKIVLAILQSDASSASKSDRILSILSSFNTQDICISSIRDKINVEYGQLANAEGLSEFLASFVQDEPILPTYANKPFSFERLQAALDLALYYEEANQNKQIRDYCSQMVTRLKSVSDNPDFEFLRAPVAGLEDHDRESTQFVDRLLGIARDGQSYRKERQLCIIDRKRPA